MGERISAEDFTEACVYLREEPLDPALLAALAELLAGLANGPLNKQDKSMWNASDFIAPPWQTSAQQPESAASIAANPADSAPSAAQLRAILSGMQRR